jgi:hypothetical protein
VGRRQAVDGERLHPAQRYGSVPLLRSGLGGLTYGSPRNQ